MALGDRRTARARGGRHGTKLVWVRNDVPRAGALVERHDLLTAKPDRELAVPFAHLDRGSRHRRLTGDPVEDAVVREVAFPTDFALFHPEAFPGPITRKRGERFLLPAVHRPLVGRGMGPLVQPVTPGECLPVQIVQIAKMYAGPKRRLHHADTALDLPLRLGHVRLAYAGSDPETRHEISKERVPTGRVILHPYQHTFHPVSQNGAGN